jgi:hypothetical protein
LIEQIRKEKSKIKRLIPKGAKEYYLITNVPGTSHLDVGSMDELNSLFAQVIEIPFTCWWRDDLDRRLDSAWSVKWAYPSLMTGQDMLVSILNTGLIERAADRRAAILSYIATQYGEDEEVKFKQVELQNKILDLFVDLPVSWKIPEENREGIGEPHLPVTKEMLDSGLPSASNIQKFSRNQAIHFYRHRRQETLAAASVLLNSGFSAFASQCVLEGAPGQGKSTIVQYLCQVHRIKLLKKNDELKRLPGDHRDAAIRLPIKLDLRDYATWLDGSDPFAPREASIPSGQTGQKSRIVIGVSDPAQLGWH